jgi:hypothetical protein
MGVAASEYRTGRAVNLPPLGRFFFPNFTPSFLRHLLRHTHDRVPHNSPYSTTGETPKHLLAKAEVPA